MAETRPEEFQKFAELLMENAPDGYRPWFFRCNEASKAPDTSFGSWKQENARLSVSQAVKWMERGNNVGIAGRANDRLVNVDIDDEDETTPDDLKPTLIARSRSRTGAHGWYFESDHGEDIPNIPTDDKGEVRADWQYVVAPGSYVPVDDESALPPDERADAGYYTVEREHPVASLRYEELPDVFIRANKSADDVEVDTDGVAGGSVNTDESTADTSVADFSSNPNTDNSALFGIEATDVVRKENGSTKPSERWSGIFHDSDTGENMSVSGEGLLHCWRHNVAHNGLQALAVLSDYSGSCEAVGSPHKGSNAGASCLQQEDGAHVWHAWKYAKQNNYIPDDDPVPYAAIKHICRVRDFCPITQLPDGPDDSIPNHAWNAAVESIEAHDGLNPGRKRTDEFDDDDSGESTPPTPQTVDTTTGGQTDESTEEADTSEISGSGDADAEMGTDPDAPSTDWEHILKGYRSADSADDRLPFRYDAVSLLDDSHAWRNIAETDVLWSYDSDTGTFHEDGEQEVRARLVDRLKERFKTQESNEVAAQLRGRNTVSEDQMGGPANKIACENGVLDISEHPPTLKDHDPSHNFLSGLGTEYDATAECPRFEQFLAETVPDTSDRLKLQEYAGYCLMHWQLPQHKTLFLVGPTASGKSTFLDTIRAMLGSNSTASLSPQQMTSERFGGAELYGAWANIRNDINSDMIENTGTFKELAAGDPVKAEKKYKDPFMFSPTTKHLFSANQLPEAATDDEAFYRRILLVAFPETIPRPERDPALDDKLQDELPGVLNWALKGLDRMMEQGRFTGDRSPGETQKTWEKWCNSVKRFAKVCIEEAGDEELIKKEGYKAYQGFCEDEGIPVETQHKFTRDLKSYADIEDGRTYVGAGGGRKRIRVYYDCQLTAQGQQFLEQEEAKAEADASPTGSSEDGVTDY